MPTLPDTSAPLFASLVSDLTAAAGDGFAPGIDFNALTATVTTSGATTYGTESFFAAQNGLRSAESTLTEQIGEAGSRLPAVSFSSDTARQAITGLSLATTDAAQLAWLSRARGYVGRAIANLMGGGA